MLITRTGDLKEISKAKKPGKRRRVHYTVDLDYVGAVKRFFQQHATIFEKLYVLSNSRLSSKLRLQNF